MRGLRVAVVGAGVGGLCLAQGLHRAGVDVAVYERDPALASRRQGYRLHVDARAGLALARCLPPELLELFLATCGRPGTRLTVVSEQLRLLHEVRTDPSADPFAPATLSTSANRQTLREVLAAGLDGQVFFGRELTRYEAADDGVRLYFAGGRPADADLLVGADGVSSAVRRQYLPHAEIIDTGSRCIYGKTPLREAALDLLPPALIEGFMAIVGGHVGMAAGLVQFRTRPEQAAAAITPRTRLSPAADYLMWAVSADRGRFGVPQARLGELDPAGLHALATKMIRSWHPNLRGLVALADIDETFLVRIRASVPVPGWPPSRVTLLGDAIHAMSPARGSGANTALQDAGLLCRTLNEPAPEGRALVQAIGRYETQMREYGYAAAWGRWPVSGEPERTSWRGMAGLLAALAVSETGTRMSSIALPWLVLITTGSAAKTGLVAFCEMAPYVVAQFLPGPLLDRVGARRASITGDVVNAVAALTIPVLHVTGACRFPSCSAWWR